MRAMLRMAGPALGLAGLVLLLTRDVVFRGRAYFESDIQLFWHPRAAAFRQALDGGALPLWNPWTAFGQPMLADATTQVLYPPTWLELLLAPATYHSVYVLLHLLFTAWGLYRLARGFGLSREGAVLAAGAWTASGPVLSLVYVWNHFAGTCWVPWVLLAARAALRRPGRGRALLWGGATAVQLFTGSPDLVLYTQGPVVLLAGAAWKAGPDRRRILGTIALAAAFAVGISAVQWLPTLEVALRSVRQDLDVTVQQARSVHPVLLAQGALPVFPHELPLGAEAGERLYGSRLPFLDSLYLGMPVLLLAALGLLPRAGAGRRTWLAVLLAGVVLALGSHTPVHGWLTRFPPLSILRFPAKAAVLVALAAAMLAGRGLDTWKRGASGGRAGTTAFAILAGLAGAACLLLAGTDAPWAAFLPGAAGDPGAEAIAATRRGLAVTGGVALGIAAVTAVNRRAVRAAGGVLLVAAALLDLAVASRGINRTVPRDLLDYRPGTVDAVGSDGSRLYAYDYHDLGRASRYLGRTDPFVVARLPAGMSADEAKLIGRRLYLYPPIAGQWGLEGSFDMDFSALYSPELERLMIFLREREGSAAHARLLRLGSVGHVVALHTEGLQDLEAAGAVSGSFPEEIRLFRVPDPLPRVRIAGGSRIARGEAALAAIVADDFDPVREIVLPEGSPVPCPPGFESTYRVVTRRPDRMTVEAELSHAGFLVVADGWDPGWRARVDDAATPVVRANVAWRAVALPPGRHTVEMAYRPAAAGWGAAVSLLALAGAAAAAARGRRAGKEPERGPLPLW